MRTYLKTLALTVSIVLMTNGCIGPRYSQELVDINSYLIERPDSALAALRTINPEDLGRADEAYWSLLHSIALDKCYIDLQADSIVSPAVAYYSHHGSADERLKMHYYYARIFENQGDNETAMSELVRGERFARKCTEYNAAGRLFGKKSEIYYYLHDIEPALANARTAAEFYLKSGYTRGYHNSLLDISNCQILQADYSGAAQTLEQLADCYDQLTDYQRGRLYENRIIIATEKSVGEALAVARESLRELKDSANIPWGKIADAYQAANLPDSAYHFLSQEAQRLNVRNLQSFYLRLSRVYESLNEPAEALDAYKHYMYYSESRMVEMLDPDTKYVEERSRADAQAHSDRHTKWLLAMALLLAIAIIYAIGRSLKSHKEDIEAKDALIKEIKEELESLQKMKDEQYLVDKDTMTIIEGRISLLNSYLLAEVNPSYRRKAKESLHKVLKDKDSFFVTTALLFATSHTSFVEFLREQGLTDWEIGFCCMYLTGMNGKDLGAFLDNQNSYNISSTIRHKLGLSATNKYLDVFLREKLSELDSAR